MTLKGKNARRQNGVKKDNSIDLLREFTKSYLPMLRISVRSSVNFVGIADM